MEPSKTAFSFCLFKFAGFSGCWGCGIGHAIHYALHLQFGLSWQHHIAGVPAAAYLLFKSLNFLFLKFNKTNQHGRTTVFNDATGIATR
jgi:hypothetical protein